MDDQTAYIELVKQAQAGDRKSLEVLAGRVRGRLYAYVYRIVLDGDLAQDIVQESMLEMFRVLGKLDKADSFWPWLRAIAFSKLRRHHSQRKNRPTLSMSNLPEPAGPARDGETGLAGLVAEELRQVVLGAMRELRPQYRRVLTMRCYEDMAYSEIAQLMGCSELTARVTFCRAKRTLQKHLSRRGLGRGFLVTALVLFGKMTAPSEAAAASVSVTAATTKVGVAAGLAALATSKVGVLSLAAAGAVAAGTIAVTSWSGGPASPWSGEGNGANVTWLATGAAEGAEECWYYYPHDVGGPVMMRLVKWEPQGRGSYCKWWQDGGPNYYFDEKRNTIHINNHRIWDSGLSVMRLPTDEVNMREFISMVEGGADRMHYVSAGGPGLLVITRWGGDENRTGSRAVRHYNLLDEEYFRYKWPPDAKVVDNRDAMHKRGWTYFRVDGSMGPDNLTGGGRLPFVYAESSKNYAWLTIKVGGRLRVEDNGSAALLYDGQGQAKARFEGGSLFKGLGRPWMGLHTIDTVRRDAAEQRVWFETKGTAEPGKMQIELKTEGSRLVYTIDMQLDVVDKIRFVGDSDGQVKGEIRFSYLQDVDETDNEFIAPRRTGSGRNQVDRLGILWLVNLAEGVR